MLGKTESRNSSYEVTSVIQFKNSEALHYGTNISGTKGWNKKTQKVVLMKFCKRLKVKNEGKIKIKGIPGVPDLGLNKGITVPFIYTLVNLVQE